MADADNGLLDSIRGVFGDRHPRRRRNQQGDATGMGEFERAHRVLVDKGMLDRRDIGAGILHHLRQGTVQGDEAGGQIGALCLNGAVGNVAESRSGKIDHPPSGADEAGINADDAQFSYHVPALARRVNEGQREVYRGDRTEIRAGRFDFSTGAAYRGGMVFVLLLAVIVPLLAVPGGAWLLEQLVPGAETALWNPDILWAQGALAAAPLVALAVFALFGRRQAGALNATAVLTALMTLAVWGWYHAGGPGIAQDSLGLAMLVSPLVIGALTFIVYCLLARATR